MTTPISDLGTVSKEWGDTYFYPNGSKTNYSLRHRYRQRPPYNLVLPYLRMEGRVIGKTNDGGIGGFQDGPASCSSNNSRWWPEPQITQLKNLSYERLRGNLYDQAALGVDFAEYRQSLSMISESGLALLRAAWYIKRGNFYAASRVLRMRFLPKGVSYRKTFANNWLEFHFGWVPLISDIHDAAEVLNNPIKAFNYEKGKASDRYYRSLTTDFGSATSVSTTGGTVFVQQGARVSAITNSGLHTLDQFGLINPGSIAWELVPFSFVVDWFVNVGDFLSSLSDFAGMRLDSTFCTYGFKLINSGTYALKPGYGTATPRTWANYWVGMERTTTLSGISLALRPLRLPSKTRAATIISLLVQQFQK